MNKKFDWFGIPKVFHFLVPYKWIFLTLIVCMSISGLTEAAFPLFQEYAITHFIGENTLDTILLYIFAYLALLLVQVVVNIIGCYASCKVEVLVDEDIRQACFDHIQTLSFTYFNQNSVGYIHSRVMSDPDKIGMMVSWGLMDVCVNIPYLVGIFIIMFTMSPKLAWILLLEIPALALALGFFQSRLTDATRKVREINSQITSDYNEGITGAKTIKSLVIEDSMEREFKKDTAEMHMASIRAGRYRALFQAGISLISSVALAMVLWRGGYLTKNGLLQLGALTVFMNYSISIAVYVRELVGTVTHLLHNQVNIERVCALLETDSDVKDSPQVIEKYGDTFAPKKENWEPLHGDIAFKDVTFQYPDGDEIVLEHFNLEVPKGTMIAIVGETGAGKSTLINLVCRFYEPTRGRVLIDGRDVRERSQLWLHSHIGYVLQTPHLFSGTVMENLLYGNPDASKEEIDLACRRVCADKIIARMDKGYESEVGEGGVLLSTGEKQLLSFARAIIADPEILILDEATSSVDTLTEKNIQDAIKEVTKGRTSFVIAHRLSTIRSADHILVMKDGKIIESGTHADLMSMKGYYYDLYTTQLRSGKSDEVLGKNKSAI